MLTARRCSPRCGIPSRFRRVVLLLTILALLPSAASAREHKPRRGSLDWRIDAILRASGAERGFWGIEVAALPNGRILYRRDAQHLFLPASNLKLFTTAAALESLGPDFVFHTTVESDAPPDAQGRVQNLYLVGRGDPNLGSRVLPYRYQPSQPGIAATGANPPPVDRVFQELAEQVRARGVREVAGKVIADDTYYLCEPYSHNWAIDDMQWGYGAPVTALAFNDNALDLHFRPGAKAGDPAKVWLDPVPDYYKLDNRLMTGAAGTEKQIFVERAPGSMELDVWGQIPADALEDSDTVSIEHPPQLAGEIFRKALEAHGIAVRGPVSVAEVTRPEAAMSPGVFPPAPHAVVLAQHDSLPLREDIKLTLKVSQNLHADMLLRTLAHETQHYGSLTVGLEILNRFAEQVGAAPGATYFADGSGLSREDLVAPDALLKLLLFMARSPRFGVFFDSLPVAGLDGTLAERFRGSRAEGRIHAKTGTVEHVNALSGYMDLPSGKRLAFSIMGNSYTLRSRDGAAAVDHIALAIYDWYSRRKRL